MQNLYLYKPFGTNVYAKERFVQAIAAIETFSSGADHCNTRSVLETGLLRFSQHAEEQTPQYAVLPLICVNLVCAN